MVKEDEEAAWKDELQLLDASVLQMRVQIDLMPKNKSAGGTKESLRRRRELQQQVEVSLMRSMALVEMQRVADVTRQAVESGFVIEARQVVCHGECPLCMEEIPDCEDRFANVPPSARLPCCGVVCCRTCQQKISSEYNTRLDSAENQFRIFQAVLSGNDVENDLLKFPCPFCRQGIPRDKDEVFPNELRNAAAGKAWAQLRVGEDFLRQWINSREKDCKAQQQATYWLTLAAEQGELDAQAALSRLTQCNDTALQQAMVAARLGEANAQRWCAKLIWEKQGVVMNNDPDALIWATLAAAQGHPTACHDLGIYYTNVPEATRCKKEGLFRAYYWFKKASLQPAAAPPEAQLALANAIMRINYIMFDGLPNQVRYSCLPEVFFWHRRATNGQDPTAESLRLRYDFTTTLQSCAVCGVKARGRRQGSVQTDETVTLHRCVQCHSIVYCSRECQRKHWRMGHKVDCLVVKELQKTVELPSIREP